VGFLSNFDEDVFISYAHNDDDVYGPERSSWVTRLHHDLERRLRNYLGTDIRFWRDCEIRNNDDFTNKIFKRLTRTATFLSVLSPSFLQREWCKRELEAFAGHAEGRLGILIDNERSRIFKAEKMPVERNALPRVMQGTKTYRFYEPNPSNPQSPHELRPDFGTEFFRRYFEQMDELAKDIAMLLKEMSGLVATGKQAQTDRVTVYVAETTSGLDDKAAELRRDLKDRGYLVLPSGDLPYRAGAYKDKVRECLKQAVLSIHLVDAEYGFVPEGETRSNVWLQHDLALERSADPNFLRLIWIPGEVTAPDKRQQEFLTYLHEDESVQQGADLLNGNIEDLKTVIHEFLAKTRRRQETPQPPSTVVVKTGVSAHAPDEPVRVYIMCDRADRKAPPLVALRKWLLTQGCEPVLPSEGEDESAAVQIHVENLGLCDACLIYYGEGSPGWFEAKLRDLRKYLRGRQPAVAAKAIYLAPPFNDDKDEVATLEAVVLQGSETFSCDAIEPFMQKILAGAQGA
jgi:TIR domain